jgi:excisionase family DNA binding protein
MPIGALLTVKEVAALLNHHPFTIYALIYQGKIKAVKVRGMVRILDSEAERLADEKERLEKDLTVKDVCSLLACSRSTVLRIIKDGKIETNIVKHRFIITPQSLEKYIVSLTAA